MSPAANGNYREQLLIEWFAEKLGFYRLSNSDRLPGDIYPPYLLLATTLFVHYPVIDSYNYLVGRSSVLDDPITAVTGLALILAAIGVRWMRDGYATAITDLRLSEQNRVADTERGFEQIVPLRYKVAVYSIGVLLLYVNIFVFIGLPAVLEVEGVVSTVFLNALAFPLVYVPLIVEFVLLYFGIHFLVPRKIRKADIDLFFYDPRDMGGLAPVGQLLKNSYYVFTAGLLLYFFFLYGPVIFSSVIPNPFPPSPVFVVVFSAVWVLGVISIAHSMYVMHGVMSEKKEQQIRSIEDEIRGIVEEPYDITNSYISDSEKRAEIQHQIDQVNATSEYPTTFAMWSQIAISVLLPQALNLVVQAA